MAEEQPEQQKEIILKGIGVSPGVVVGTALLVTTEDDRLVERVIAEDEIPREIARFEEALICTRRQIHDIQQRVGEAIGHDSASIFDAHLLVVDDRSFVEEVIRGLHAQRRNVESILSSVADRYADALAGLEDDYLRERAADVRDVTRRILRNLAGRSSAFLTQLEHPHIVIANDLAPSDTATLNKDKVIGFATDLGSPTSHTAIMARALAIPAVVGLHDVSVRISTGDPILIDGHKGLVIVRPTRERLERYGKIAEVRRLIHNRLATLKDELPGDLDAVMANGGLGVGLFRTEYLYLSMKSLPSEDDQYAAYDEVARRVAPGPAVIRTLDLGGDKFLSHLKTPAELNPFMGWRAIRFCLAQPDIFKTQLRAVLRAAEIAARLGGDEFVVLAETGGDLETLAQRVAEALGVSASRRQ
jgi:phosphotransferase system enzyme I (PtsI)